MVADDAPGTGSIGRDWFGREAAVAQVLAEDGSTAGTGFLAAAGIVLTCAHVVELAGQGPGGRVQLRFPHLADAPRLVGHVLASGWRESEAEDVAVLRLDATPADAQPVKLGSAAGCRGHSVFSFGFPSQAPGGGHFGYGVAGALLPPDSRAGVVLQLADANDLTTGFSGGPVVDEVTGLVIGMVTAITAPDRQSRGLAIAYATPTQVLRDALPDLVEHQVCPYRGLEPFTAEHVDWFHGRQAAVEEALAALRGNKRVLLLLGPSGAGKSSLVQAGILPALADGGLPGSDRWLPLMARPRQDLMAELERSGLPGTTSEGIEHAVQRRLAAEPADRRLVVVIDQFEELLLQGAADGPDRQIPVAQQLQALIESPLAVTVILVMRDDFYPRLAAGEPSLTKVATQGLLNVSAALSVSDLHAVITQPAHAVGARLEEGLAERIIADVLAADEHAPATRQAPATLLPPLELALSQLWERRNDGFLTHHAYDQVGGVAGSLTTWCEAALGQLPLEQRPIAQKVLTALVHPADEANATPATRRHVAVADLRALAADPLSVAQSGQAFDAVLASLTRSRVITTRTTPNQDGTPGQATAELIHDALIRDWTDLRDWVAADYQFHAWLRRVGEQYIGYTQSGHPGDLLDGTDLAAGVAWSDKRGLPQDIAAFLANSQRRQQAAIRRTRRINTALATLLCMALLAAGLAFWQQQNAVQAKKGAVTAQRVAQSRQLAAQSGYLSESDTDLSSLLSIQAYRTSPTTEAAYRLYLAARNPIRSVLANTSSGGTNAVAYSADGKLFATNGDGNTVRLRDSVSGKIRNTLTGHSDTIQRVAFSPDSTMLATACGDNTIRLWGTGTGKLQKTLFGHKGGGVDAVAFSPDGVTLASTGEDGTVRLWDIARGTSRVIITGRTGGVRSVIFSPDGRTLAASVGHEDAVHLWDVKSGKIRRTIKDPDGVMTTLFTPDGKKLLTADIDHDFIRPWNVATGKPGGSIYVGLNGIAQVVFSPEGSTIAVSSWSNAVVRQWTWKTGGDLRDVYTGHKGRVESMAFSPDGATLITGSAYDNAIRVWDMKVGRPRATLASSQRGISSAAFSPDDVTLAAGHLDGAVLLWDASNGRVRKTLTGHRDAITSVAFSPDGATLATGSEDNTARLWD
ncbi:trypsin-like peptidase domain-containing protein, partial [Streptomyces sp. NPDC055243]|uniref:nSTAND1 domain-containing NTPase n=1 Tax=Streptomyces sp. NPDC055243 TaxID=3365720 RepID=UPI0037D898BF